jgi:hypothetical protein
VGFNEQDFVGVAVDGVEDHSSVDLSCVVSECDRGIINSKMQIFDFAALRSE